MTIKELSNKLKDYSQLIMWLNEITKGKKRTLRLLNDLNKNLNNVDYSENQKEILNQYDISIARAKDRVEDIQSIINNIDIYKYKEVLTLRYIENKPNYEISKIIYRIPSEFSRLNSNALDYVIEKFKNDLIM